jgi:hypothetical protein
MTIAQRLATYTVTAGRLRAARQALRRHTR